MASHLLKGQIGILVGGLGDGLPRAFHALAMTGGEITEIIGIMDKIVWLELGF